MMNWHEGKQYVGGLPNFNLTRFIINILIYFCHCNSQTLAKNDLMKINHDFIFSRD